MKTSSLRTTDRKVLNFTKRVDIARIHVLYEVNEVENATVYRIVLRQWAELLAKIDPSYQLTIRFFRGGAMSWTAQLGDARAHIRRGGEIVGRTDGGFDANTLGAEVMISDPKDKRIVMYAKMMRPDSTDAEIVEDENVDNRPVNPFRQAVGKADGLLDISVRSDVSGQWDVNLTNVTVPQLFVSTALGKAAITNDTRTQALILPEVFRRILKAMVFEAERYGEEIWFADWKNLAEMFMDGADWESEFEDESIQEDDDEKDRRIAAAVANFTDTQIEKLAPLLVSTHNEGE
jgi:hypothetical protein